MAAQTYVHDGTIYRPLRNWWAHDGTAWRDLQKVYCHDGTDWKLIFANQSWQQLGSGTYPSGLLGLANIQGVLTALFNYGDSSGNGSGGAYTWNGTAWNKFAGLPASSSTQGLTDIGGVPYVTADDSAWPYYGFVWYWNGASWNKYGTSAAGYGGQGWSYPSIQSGPVNIGGTIFIVATGPYASVYYWVGPSWVQLGAGSWDPATSGATGLSNIGGQLYVGAFTPTPGGGPGSSQIRIWSGGAWVPWAAPRAGYINGITSVGGVIVIAAYDGVSYWDGTSWVLIGATTPAASRAVASIGGTLYAGGSGGVYVWSGSVPP